LQVLLTPNPQSTEDLAVLAKFFEDIGMQAESLQWGDEAYRLGRARILQEIGFQNLGAIQARWWDKLRRYRLQNKPERFSSRTTFRHLRNIEMAPHVENIGKALERAQINTPLVGLKPQRSAFYLKGPRGPYKKRKNKLIGMDRSAARVDEVQPEAISRRSAELILEKLAAELPEEFAATCIKDREIKASFTLIEALWESADKGVPEAVDTWMKLTKDLVAEFSSFELFYFDRRQPFGGYFKRMRGGGMWKDAALTGLAAFANKRDLEGKPVLR